MAEKTGLKTQSPSTTDATLHNVNLTGAKTSLIM